MGFFAIIRKIFAGFLSVGKAVLAGLRRTSGQAQPSRSAVRDAPIQEKQKAPALPATPFVQISLSDDLEAELACVDWPQRDVLVGTLRSPAQLDACIHGRFYYIPAPLISEENPPIRYVALFQTPRIFPNRAGIFYFGEVQRSSLVRRGSIREVPQTHGSPNDLYYRYQIRQWDFLSNPILPKEGGFVRAFTNLFLLKNVQFVPELLMGSEEEFRIFTELKRRMGTPSPDAPASGFALGDIQVLLSKGSIWLFRAGKPVGSCLIQEFSQYPCSTFRKLYSGQEESPFV